MRRRPAARLIPTSFFSARRAKGPLTAALLFDLDGTLVDTDAEHLVAFQRAFAPHGILLDRAEYVASIMGASNEMIGRKFLPHLPHDLREQTLAAKEQAYRDGLGDLQADRRRRRAARLGRREAGSRARS